MRTLRSAVRWTGFAVMAFGALTVGWGLWEILQHKTGWGLSEIERCCYQEWAIVALSLLLSGMFFFLVGAGAVLLSRWPSGDAREQSPRWTKPLTILLYGAGVGSILLATLFAGMTTEFGDSTTGIVTYCMLIGVALLFSAWGLKRAREKE